MEPSQYFPVSIFFGEFVNYNFWSIKFRYKSLEMLLNFYTDLVCLVNVDRDKIEMESVN